MNNANKYGRILPKLIFVLIQLSFALTASAYRTWKDPNTGIKWKYERLGDDKRPDAGFPQYGGSIGVDLDDADIDKTKGHESAIPITTKGAVVIPSHVDEGLGIFAIEEYAFYDCAGLTAVTIPEAVLKIGAMAFYNCSGLAKVAIPSKVTSIDQATFMYCTGLTAVTIPDRVTCIESSAFNGCNRLKEVKIPSCVSRIGSSAFKGCSALQSVTLPENCVVESLAFSGCSKLTSATIPSSVTFNGDAFYGCNLLKTVYSDDIETVKKHLRDSGMDYAQFDELTFVNLALSHEVAIPVASTGLVYDGTTKTGIVAGTGYAVVSNGSAIDAGVYTAVVRLDDGDYVWSDGSVDDKRISWKIEKATYNMSGLSFLNASFDYDGQPHSIFLSGNLPSGVVVSYVGNGKIDVGSYTVTAKFSGDSNHDEIANMTATMTIRSASTPVEDFRIVNGVLERYVGKGGAVVIPSDVMSIGELAFEGCSRLTSVTIPSSVTSIGDYAFSDCRGLADEGGFVVVRGVLYDYFGNNSTVTIPSSVTSIGEEAFKDCSGLMSVTIPSSVTSIGEWAFEDCSGLKTVTISEGVAKIGDAAFWGCSGLMSVIIPSSVTYVGHSAFRECSRLMSLIIPEGVTSIGNCAFEDCRGLTSVTISSSVTSIGGRAFYGCRALLSASIPEGVTSIGDGMFGYCSGLTSVTIPASVTGIGDWAFCNCNGLMSVTIPSSVKRIGGWAFKDCNALTVVNVGKGDIERVRGLYEWPSSVEFVEMVVPVVEGDEGATVTGDAETGFVVKPSEGKTAVEVTIPQGVDAAKVTVEVSPKVTSVKPNGAKVKIVSGGADITEFLNVPAADGDGVIDLTKATVKDEIVKEALDPKKGAEIKLDAANPTLITPNTRVGLFYQLHEGTTLEGMSNGDSTVGNGQPWSPTITVKGGNSAFYSIGVGKGE